MTIRSRSQDKRAGHGDEAAAAPPGSAGAPVTSDSAGAAPRPQDAPDPGLLVPERDPLVRHQDEIRQNLVDAARRGEAYALHWCAQQLDQARRKLTVLLPPLRDRADLVAATQALLEATLRGDLSPREARDIGQLVELHLSALTAEKVEDQIGLIKRARR